MQKKGRVVIVSPGGRSLGGAYIGTALKNAGYNVSMFTTKEIEKLNERQKEIIKKAIFVGFPTYSIVEDKLKKNLQKIKKINKRVVAGGWGVTHSPEIILKGYKFPVGVTGVFGEALDTIVDLADYWQKNPKSKKPDVKGIAYINSEGKLVETEKREPKKMPKIHEDIPSRFLFEKDEESNTILLPILMRNFGCNHAIGGGCKFCDIAYEMNKIDKKKIIELRNFDKETVKNNFLLALKKAEKNKNKIFIELLTDAAVSQDLENFYSVYSEIPKRYKRKIEGMILITRPDINYINEKFLKLIEKQPFNWVSIQMGVESFNQNDLNLVNKNTDNKEFFKLFEELQKRNVNVTTFNILKISDDPNALKENLEKLEESIKKGVVVAPVAAISDTNITGKPLSLRSDGINYDLFYGLDFKKLNEFEEIIDKWGNNGLDMDDLKIISTNKVESKKNVNSAIKYIRENLGKEVKKYKEGKNTIPLKYLTFFSLMGKYMLDYLNDKMDDKSLEIILEALNQRIDLSKEKPKIKKKVIKLFKNIYGRLKYGNSFEYFGMAITYLSRGIRSEKYAQVIMSDDVKKVVENIPEKYRLDAIKINEKIKELGVSEKEVRKIFLCDRYLDENITIMKRYLTKKGG